MTKFSSKSLLGLALVLSFIVALLVYNLLNNAQHKANQNAAAPVIENELSNEMKAAGFTGTIPRDKRAVSLSVNDVTGVAGLIKPGDYVDVIIITDQDNLGPVANLTFQNILVLATNKTVKREEKDSVVKEEKMTTLTIAVSPDEATTLGLAGAKGTVSFALRPHANTERAQVDEKTLHSFGGNARYTPVTTPTPAYTPQPEPAPVSNYSSSKSITVIRGTKAQDVTVE